MSPKLILIRGLPGSGKSTLAREIAKEQQAVHLEADMYFEDALGNYCYEADKIGQAHQWCQKQAHKALKESRTVIVSNTFVCHWEMEPYLEMAEKFSITPEIRICTGEFQNIHGVDEETIQKMREKWEP